MLTGYAPQDGRLERLQEETLDSAIWIDLHAPTPDEGGRVRPLIGGAAIPALEDMEEIEVSNRLYRDGAVNVLTVMLPTLTGVSGATSGPVTFMLGPNRLVTVRHIDPRPFATYPARADKTGFGCGSPEAVMLGLTEEIIGRLADLLERSGRELDSISESVLGIGAERQGRWPRGERLQTALERVSVEGDTLSRLRLSLLTLERALGFLGQALAGPGRVEGGFPEVIRTQLADVNALAEHADFLTQKVSLVLNATLGMIDLAQNDTVRTVSVVAALFLPPTLIASAYGMNFAQMPELAQPWGYPAALGMMVASALLTYLFFKWRKWL